MDKKAIKTFAIESRKKLIEEVKYQANLLGITHRFRLHRRRNRTNLPAKKMIINWMNSSDTFHQTVQQTKRNITRII